MGRVTAQRTMDDAANDHDRQPPRPPLQFSLKSLLAMAVVTAVLFGTLQWCGLSPFAIGIVLAVLVVSALAAVGLVVAIASASDRDE